MFGNSKKIVYLNKSYVRNSTTTNSTHLRSRQSIAFTELEKVNIFHLAHHHFTSPIDTGEHFTSITIKKSTLSTAKRHIDAKRQNITSQRTRNRSRDLCTPEHDRYANFQQFFSTRTRLGIEISRFERIFGSETFVRPISRSANEV